jgi:hypothetical protein
MSFVMGTFQPCPSNGSGPGSALVGLCFLQAVSRVAYYLQQAREHDLALECHRTVYDICENRTLSASAGLDHTLCSCEGPRLVVDQPKLHLPDYLDSTFSRATSRGRFAITFICPNDKFVFMDRNRAYPTGVF